jgi:hypothetical protein
LAAVPRSWKNCAFLASPSPSGKKNTLTNTSIF